MPKIETSDVVWYTDRRPSPRGKYMRIEINEREPTIDSGYGYSTDSGRHGSFDSGRSGAFDSGRGATSDSGRSVSSPLLTVGAVHRPPDPFSHLRFFKKTDVLQWLHQSKESDVTWVLERLVETKPHLVLAVVSSKLEPAKYEPNKRLRSSTRAREARQRKQHEGSGGLFGDPIVQFASPVFYAEEGVDNVMVLDVMRIGNQEGTSEVFYETQDDSALNGRSFLATSGKLVFNPGETLVHIEISIVDNPLWDTTTEFICRLNQEGLKGAVLGNYLHQTRVKIIDSNCFPTDSFQHLVCEEEVLKCNKWELLRGFLIMACNIPTVWSGSVLYFFVDAFQNSMYLLELFMSVYILDYVLDTSQNVDDLLFVRDRFESLIICCIINMVAIAISHLLDYARNSFTLIAPARNFLQKALLRKFLNYTNVVRERLPPGKVMVAMERDVLDLVSEGYINTLKIFKATSRMVLMIGFKLLSPVVFGGTYDWHACVILLVIPFVVMVFVQAREDLTKKCLHDRNEAHGALTNQISTTTSNFHLVIDYSMRNHCEHRFRDIQQKYGLAAMVAAQVHENNVYFCKWCQTMLIIIWLLYGGLQVIQGSLTLGFFATNLQLFKEFGYEFLELYSITTTMMHTFPALEHITTLMNFPTDVRQRYRIERKQRAEAKAQRVALRTRLEQSGTRSIPIDIMPLVLNFESPFRFEGKERTLNFMGRVEIHQGQVLAVIGSMGCGKATLLRLIAGSVLPSENLASPIFVPSHLRVANVADEPLFFAGTLYENLIFGMDERKADASRERVQAICKRLTKSHLITDYLDFDDEHRWQDIFSGAQSKLLSIARALIHNAEVLCIHKPLVKLSQLDSEHVITALHDHIDTRGLELPHDVHKRRPRTIILSAATDRAIEEAHSVLIIDMVSGIRLQVPE